MNTLLRKTHSLSKVCNRTIFSIDKLKKVDHLQNVGIEVRAISSSRRYHAHENNVLTQTDIESINRRFDALEKRLDSLNERIDHIEQMKVQHDNYAASITIAWILLFIVRKFRLGVDFVVVKVLKKN